VLLECARLHSNPQELSAVLHHPVDWSRLCVLAEENGLLAGLRSAVAQTAEPLIPIDAQQKLKEFHRAQLIFSLQLTSELFRLLERFAAAHIEMVVIKGPVLSMRCYGDPAARQYTDLDLIVQTKDIRRSTEIMLELGYEPRIPLQAIANRKIPGEYVFRRPDTSLLVEFHTEHTFRYHPRRLPLEKVLARKTWVSIDHRQVPALSIEDELVLICIHAAKHLWERLAWVADVAAFVANDPTLNWSKAISAAEEVGAERMLRVGLGLAANLSALQIPREIEAYVTSDSVAVSLVERIATQLKEGRPASAGIIRRAAFRVRMRGGFWPGLSYLLRLSLSPTEDDWSADAGSNRPWLVDALSRPFRLGRKYHRSVEE
jgi:hypothetical protein